MGFQEKFNNLMSGGREINGQWFTNNELLELARIGVKHGVIPRIAVTGLENRLNKGLEMGPIPGYSNRDYESMLMECLADPDVRAEMLTKRDSEVSGVNKDRST